MFIGIAALLYTGLVQSLISPPLGWIFLHPFVWVPAFWVFSHLEGRRAFFAGWLVGTTANLAIFYWLSETMMRFGGLPMPVACLIWALFAAVVGFHTAVFAWGFGRIRRFAGSMWPLAIAIWFCALEFLQPQLFGYLQGVAWYQVPRVFLVSALAGVSAVSFLVVLGNALVFQVMEMRRDGLGLAESGVARTAAILTLALALAVGYSSSRLATIRQAESMAPSLRLAIIQPNHTIARRNELRAMEPQAFARDMIELSRAALEQAQGIEPLGGIDAYVWPEGALRADPSDPRNSEVLDFVRETQAEVWTGANHYEHRSESEVVAHNAAFRVYADGAIDERYDKNILVPFGEYVPLVDVIPGFDRLPTLGQFEAGTTVPQYKSGETTFVFLICYEAIRSSFVRAALGDDVNLLTNVTVDAWYGDSSEQSQHLMLAAIQSALHGLPLVRSTTTGISAFVDARGLIRARTGVFTRETALGIVRPLRVPSFYSRWGDWLAWLFVGLSMGLILLTTRRECSLD
jgi:apolipoprotein N-acyltransferase